MKRLRYALVVFLLVGRAFGADAASEALFKDAIQKSKTGDHLGALESFKSAHERTGSAPALLGVASSLWNLGRFAEAADKYEQYLADPKMNPAKKDEAKEWLSDSLAKIATLRFDADPNARVTVDGKETKTIMRVDPGAHVVVAEDGNGPPVTVQLTVKAGEARTVALHRKPDATGADKGERKPEASGGSKTLGYVLGGIGVVGLGVGAVTAIVLSGKDSTVSQDCEPKANPPYCRTQAGHDAAQDGAKLVPVFYGSVIVGVLGLGAGAYFIFSSGSDGASTAVQVGPRGASIVGKFL